MMMVCIRMVVEKIEIDWFKIYFRGSFVVGLDLWGEGKKRIKDEL